MQIVPYIVFDVLFALPALLGMVVIGIMTRGAARVLGVIGCAVLLISQALSSVWSIMLPQLMSQLQLSMVMASLPLSIFRVVSAIGLILVISAVVAGRRKQPEPQPFRPVGPPPAPPQGPYQPAPQ